MRVILLVAAFGLGFGQAQAVVESKFRSSLRTKFASSICKKAFPDHPMEVWKLGIFEAQIAGKIYAPFQGKKLSKYFLSAQSKSMARKNFHLSRIWGFCKDGTGWVGSWPASQALIYRNGRELVIPYTPLQTHCSEFRIDYAAHAGGQPKQLTLGPIAPKTAHITINLADLDRGTVAVTCYPKEPAWRGPVMWYFAPVKDGPPVSVPFSQQLYKSNNLDDNLLGWIHAVRAAEGLPILKSHDKALGVHARSLASHPELTHDRRQLKSIAEKLAANGLMFLGENRFRGQSNLEIGWLLWNSPRHRSLILSKKATQIAVGARVTGNERFGSIIVAQ